jgi:hypothetical protein
MSAPEAGTIWQTGASMSNGHLSGDMTCSLGTAEHTKPFKTKETDKNSTLQEELGSVHYGLVASWAHYTQPNISFSGGPSRLPVQCQSFFWMSSSD